MKLFGSITELVSAIFRKDSQLITLRPSQSVTYTSSIDVQLPPQDDPSITLVSSDGTQVLINKTIDGDDNTVQDLALSSLKTVLGDANKPLVRDGSGVVSSALLVNANIDAAAAIDATKIADGSVTNAEFQALNGLSGAITTASNTQTLTNKTIDGDDNTVQDLALGSLKTVGGDADKVLRRDGSGVVVSGNALPNSSALVTIDSTSTLSNKTLASPVITTAATLNAQGELRLADFDSSNYISFKAPSSVTSNVNYTLPAADGASSNVLSTNGSGTLSWVAGGTGTPGQLPGTSTDDNASAGNVGEAIAFRISSSTALTAASGIFETVGSITLSAGDWDVTCGAVIGEGVGFPGGTLEVGMQIFPTGGSGVPGITNHSVRCLDASLFNYTSVVLPTIRVKSDGTDLEVEGVLTAGTQTLNVSVLGPQYTVSPGTVRGLILAARRAR